VLATSEASMRWEKWRRRRKARVALTTELMVIMIS
jgi:hypothetical protein